MTLTVGSLFAGIGGFDLGLERTGGFRTAWFCEQDKFCQRVLAKHWPGVPCYEDVCALTGASVSPVDVLCGGFPCQDISLAGKGAGIGGSRSGLWSEYARLIGEIEPRWVIVENVAALLGRGLSVVLADLSALGYDAEWDCIPASAVGAPHRRDRVWIVAYPERIELWEQPVCECGDDGAAKLVADATHKRHERSGAARDRRTGPPDSSPGGASDWWATEPDVGRGLDGFSSWLDRRVTSDGLQCISKYANDTSRDPAEVLRMVRGATSTQNLQRTPRGRLGISSSEVLFTYLRELAQHADERCASLAGAEIAWPGVRGVRSHGEPSGAPCGPEPGEQYVQECADVVQDVSRLLARHAEAAWVEYRGSDACPSLGWEDGISRVATGIPARVDRLRSLGNALVPQIPEWIGYRILDYEAERGRP